MRSFSKIATKRKSLPTENTKVHKAQPDLDKRSPGQIVMAQPDKSLTGQDLPSAITEEGYYSALVTNKNLRLISEEILRVGDNGRVRTAKVLALSGTAEIPDDNLKIIVIFDHMENPDDIFVHTHTAEKD